MNAKPLPVARSIAELRRRVGEWRAAGRPHRAGADDGRAASRAFWRWSRRRRRSAVASSCRSSSTQSSSARARFSRPTRGPRPTTSPNCGGRGRSRLHSGGRGDVPGRLRDQHQYRRPERGSCAGAQRPGHFDGVATVVAKLLIQVAPDAAFFGEKDYQQLLVVRRMARDLNLPVEIVGVPTVREPDGLALSSRNLYLSPEERGIAPNLNRIMRDAAAEIAAGAAPARVLERAIATLNRSGFVVEYLELRDAATLAPLPSAPSEPARLLAAVHLGRTRLIDNIPVRAEG